MNPNLDDSGWQRWRRAVAERIDRRSLVGALVFGLLLAFQTNWVPAHGAGFAVATTMLWGSSPVIALLLWAPAAVSVDRGAPGWLAYPLALLLGSAAHTLMAWAVFSWLAPHYVSNGLLHLQPQAFLFMISPAVPLYLYANSAARLAKVLKTAETERATETARLAQEQLQMQLASIDHDLVIAAMQQSLSVREAEPERAESLLMSVTEYLRAAQQREGTDAQRIADTLAELRQACGMGDHHLSMEGQNR